MEDIAVKTYCNCLAKQRGLDPVGHAHGFDDAIIIELPLPWKEDIMQRADPLPQEIIDLLALWLQRYHAGEGYRHRPLVVAPDKDYSKQGHHRVLFYTRPKGMMSAFDKVEYLMPAGELGPLVWSLYQAPDQLSHFDAYRVPEADSVRDILVCTHGTIDAACAKFGYPLYRHMRENFGSDQLRVWRVSHFGGHVFAPTLMDMPIGHYWAYVGEAQAEQIICRSGDVAALRGYYRGWAGLDGGFLQAAECELWQRHGWPWFSYLKSGKLRLQDTESDHPTLANVEICYATSHTSTQETYELQVEIHDQIETEHSTANTQLYAYPQYRVREVVARQSSA
ncbi:MAG: hypothetical protein K8L99_31490 [Anaerolineae bacterium]|nr:hypothetical protein [Anaerolineae bacterium]